MEKRDSVTGKPTAEMTPQHPETAPPAEPSPVLDVALNAAVQARIGRELRAVFNEVVNEPVPDRFRDLLAALEAKTARRP